MRTLNRYAEQLWLTLFARAREITLFDIRSVYQPIRQADGSSLPESNVLRTAGYAFEQVDSFLGQLGNRSG